MIENYYNLWFISITLVWEIKSSWSSSRRQWRQLRFRHRIGRIYLLLSFHFKSIFSWSLSRTMNFVTMIFFYYYYNLWVSMSSIILKNSESNFSRTMINISIINSVISASDAMFWNKRLVYICYACVWIFSQV